MKGMTPVTWACGALFEVLDKPNYDRCKALYLETYACHSTTPLARTPVGQRYPLTLIASIAFPLAWVSQGAAFISYQHRRRLGECNSEDEGTAQDDWKGRNKSRLSLRGKQPSLPTMGWMRNMRSTAVDVPGPCFMGSNRCCTC